MKVILGTLILLGLNVQVFAARKVETVAAVFLTQSSKIFQPTINLYQASLPILRKEGSYQLAHNKDILKFLPLFPNNLKSLPILPRIETKENTPFSTQAIQEALETNLIEQAFVIDCEPAAETNKASMCQILLYERSRAGVAGRVAKKFDSPITDPSKWAGPLVTQLLKGMREHQKIMDQKSLEDFVQHSKENENPLRFGLTAIAGNELLKFNKANLKATPIFGGQLTIQKKLSGIGVQYLRAQSLAKTKYDRAMKYSLTSYGLVFSASTLALESLLWGMQVGVGINQRSFQTDSLTLETRSNFVALKPMVGWLITDYLSCSLGFTFQKDFYNNLAGKDEFEGAEIASLSNSFDFSLKLTL